MRTTTLTNDRRITRPIVVVLTLLLGFSLAGLTSATVPGAWAAWTAASNGTGAARATVMEAGGTPTATVAGSSVELSWAPASTSNGVPATAYEVRRHDASGAVAQTIVSGTCSSPVTTTSCVETSVPDGTWRYTVTPRLSSWRGAVSPATTVRVDTAAPSAAITFPAAATTYSEPSYLSGCGTASVGDLCGTAADNGSGLAQVQVSLQQTSTGNYWNGSAFTATSETRLAVTGPASGTNTWSYPFASQMFPMDGTYTLRAHATDNVGLVSTATSTFTIDRTGPPAPTITSAPANPSSSDTATFGFANTETAVNFECRLDGATFAPCTSPRTYPGLAEGSHTFQVRAVDAVGNPGTATTYTWSIDTNPPTVSILFPAAGSARNNTTHDSGCGTSAGDLCGTAADSSSGVTSVEVSIQQGTGTYWRGNDFFSVPERWFTATGTTTWSYAFPASNYPAEGQYTLRARATDATGKTTIAASTFTIDRTAPTATNIEAHNGTSGTTSRVDQTDTIRYTYSEPVAPASLLAGWDGTTTAVVVRFSDGVTGNDTITVFDAANTSPIPLGTLNLGRSDYTDRNHTFTATMIRDANAVVVSLGTRSVGPTSPIAAGPGTMTWTPASAATDQAGNPATTATLTEPGTLDNDF